MVRKLPSLPFGIKFTPLEKCHLIIAVTSLKKQKEYFMDEIKSAKG